MANFGRSFMDNFYKGAQITQAEIDRQARQSELEKELAMRMSQLGESKRQHDEEMAFKKDQLNATMNAKDNANDMRLVQEMGDTAGLYGAPPMGYKGNTFMGKELNDRYKDYFGKDLFKPDQTYATQKDISSYLDYVRTLKTGNGGSDRAPTFKTDENGEYVVWDEGSQSFKKTGTMSYEKPPVIGGLLGDVDKSLQNYYNLKPSSSAEDPEADIESQKKKWRAENTDKITELAYKTNITNPGEFFNNLYNTAGIHDSDDPKVKREKLKETVQKLVDKGAISQTQQQVLLRFAEIKTR